MRIEQQGHIIAGDRVQMPRPGIKMSPKIGVRIRINSTLKRRYGLRINGARAYDSGREVHRCVSRWWWGWRWRGARRRRPRTSIQVKPKRAAPLPALASGDPAKRDEAAKALIRMGAEARHAVFEASRSEDPELRARAAELLLKLPWFLPDDSPEVRRLLVGYGQLDVEKRKEAVGSAVEAGPAWP